MKDGYNHSNKNNYVKQILAHYHRRHSFAMRVLNLRALAKKGLITEEATLQAIKVTGFRQRGDLVLATFEEVIETNLGDISAPRSAEEYFGPGEFEEEEIEVCKVQLAHPERHRKLRWPYDPQIILNIEDLMICRKFPNLSSDLGNYLQSLPNASTLFHKELLKDQMI